VSTRRAPALVVLAALLLGGALLDRQAREDPAAVAAATVAYVQPLAEPASALASTWYCVGAAAQPGASNNGRLVVANATTAPIAGRLTVVPVATAGPPQVREVSVPARDVLSVVLADVLQAPAVAAVVELDGGGAGVELNVEGPPGRDDMPCHSGTSDRWFFPDATTVKDAHLSLALFNPFPDDAVVDVTFATEEGAVVPPAFQAVLVAAGTVVSLDVSAHVQRKQEVATSVVARTGRVVAAEVLVLDGSEGRVGIEVVEGAPSAGARWSFPEGFVSDGLTERYVAYNPGDAPAEVEVFVSLEQGAAEPSVVDVPPRSRAVVLSGDDPRVPRYVPHAVTVRSTNDAGIVVARSVLSVAPAPRRGLAVTLGSRGDHSRWLFAEGVAAPTYDEWLVVQNPGAAEAVVSVTGLAGGQSLPIEGLQDVVIAPGRRKAFRLGDHIQRGTLPVVVSSTEPVVVERGLYVVGGPGISQSMGIPLPG
jgi:hypothetical protein